MGFTREELAACAGRAVPDLLPDDPAALRLLFVGINPGLWTAAAQAHFAHPGNRFFKALHAAGITPEPLDVSRGFDERSRAALVGRGIGITNLVERATARADELSAHELRAGAACLEAKVRAWKPRVVAVVGLVAYRTAFHQPRAAIGRQERPWAGAEVWALPNPSGLNAHYQLGELAALYRRAAQAAGIRLARRKRSV
ncbi:MAG TPA: mismatch-specific DNA-glycosylase [Gemmatimonadota bacterium]|jgi:TDG/mug DNA glycosylase family protein|nr:mismatch-specific DNA-glycosylase [Gemmatimonadota bacterium]